MSKFNADIIKDTENNTYRAIISFEDKPDVTAYGDGWRDLCDNVKFITGICFPLRKFFKWSKLSDWEQIAGIDASHVRPSCVVTIEDRRNGWMRENVW